MRWPWGGQNAAFTDLIPSITFSVTVKTGMSIKSLVDHANALSNSISRRVALEGFAVKGDFSFIRLIEPIQDVHKSGFTRAVFAQQR